MSELSGILYTSRYRSTPGTPLAGPKKGVCFGVTSYLSWGSPCSGDISQPHTWKPGCSARWLLNCQNPLSVLGKICQNQNVSVNHLGLMLCYFPTKKCFVRKFLLNSTTQKQLEYKKFSFFVPLLFLFFTDILFLKLEMNWVSGNKGFFSVQVTIMGLGKKSACSAWWS